ncbi:hypothetical protein Ancab_001938 [Ancistrocladus abbreviatus]
MKKVSDAWKRDVSGVTGPLIQGASVPMAQTERPNDPEVNMVNVNTEHEGKGVQLKDMATTRTRRKNPKRRDINLILQESILEKTLLKRRNVPGKSQRMKLNLKKLQGDNRQDKAGSEESSLGNSNFENMNRINSGGADNMGSSTKTWEFLKELGVVGHSASDEMTNRLKEMESRDALLFCEEQNSRDRAVEQEK